MFYAMTLAALYDNYDVLIDWMSDCLMVCLEFHVMSKEKDFYNQSVLNYKEWTCFNKSFWLFQSFLENLFIWFGFGVFDY